MADATSYSPTTAAHHLHGGRNGWDKAVWEAEAIERPDGPSLLLDLQSPDGEEGYPGTVDGRERGTP